MKALPPCRDFYYYPTSTNNVIVVGKGLNKSLLEQAGVRVGASMFLCEAAEIPSAAYSSLLRSSPCPQNGVSVDVRDQDPEDLSFRPASSLDGALVNGYLGAFHKKAGMGPARAQASTRLHHRPLV